jgi:hypothetical protein
MAESRRWMAIDRALKWLVTLNVKALLVRTSWFGGRPREWKSRVIPIEVEGMSVGTSSNHPIFNANTFKLASFCTTLHPSW